ncbi:hypothetical protein WK25_06200 [Burkholderia latens]|uniref:hypothetical protein n=1 Tax=Burkholderia latens TaxID=488446 RepID=UPI000841CD61|nr:hypothetical protein [Burkholderia latens]AOK04095.1 hypothetical protein WK25_06200 [Burkholderia latens]
MEPLWEYQWEYIDMPYDGPPQRTRYWMTDEEAEHWHGSKKPGARRLDDTRRDRRAQPAIPVGGGTIGAAYADRTAVDAPLPTFTSPDLPKLRYWWACPSYCGPEDIRVLILEVVRLRRLVGK